MDPVKTPVEEYGAMFTPNWAILIAAVCGCSESKLLPGNVAQDLGAGMADMMAVPPDQNISSWDMSEDPDMACSMPGLSVAPGMLNFGAVAVNQTTMQQNVGIANCGGISISMTLTLAGMSASQFKFIDPGPFSLSPGQSRLLPVQYTPQRSGMHSAVLIIMPKGFQSKTVALSGTGL